MNKVTLLLAFTLFMSCRLAPAARAELELPSIIGDNMVLQRGTDAPVWGWDTPGTTVTVSFRGREAQAEADEEGKWMGRIPTGDAGGPFELTIEGTDTVTCADVLVGEVWVAGGQSNMWWHLSNCTNAQQEIASADYLQIRMWDANTHPRQAGWMADEPQKTVQAEWKPTTPRVAGNFPGVPYFFARELHQRLDVPVGIVHLAVPGSPIEPWLSEEFGERHFPRVARYLEYREAEYPQELQEYEDTLEKWEEQREKAEEAGREPPRKPRRPRNPARAAMGGFYNGMVHPTAPYAAKGFLWWQGESNSSRALQYQILFPALIDEWRYWWGESEMPFLFVELAEFLAEQRRPVEDDSWPALRDAQHEALKVAGTYMISTIDIFLPEDSINNIHPPNKQLAGHRLYLAAMANVYGDEDLVWSGPLYRSAEFADGRAVISFDHVGSALVAKGGALNGFALAGPDRQWHWAEAEIERDTVVLRCPDVPEPVAVRYGWANNPIGNLYNREGLWAFARRTDNWLLLMKAR